MPRAVVSRVWLSRRVDQTREELRCTIDIRGPADAERFVGDVAKRVLFDRSDQRRPVRHAAPRQNVFDGRQRESFVVEVPVLHVFNPGSFEGGGLSPRARASRHALRSARVACDPGAALNSAANWWIR